jgi:hypothetical protein
MMDSALGNDYEYVLDKPFKVNEKEFQQFAANALPTGEGGGLLAHPDPGNPQRTIFASAWSE